MNSTIKQKLIIKPLVIILLGFLVAVFLIYFVPYQLSKISILEGREIPFPSWVSYFVIFAFTFKPVLKLIENLLLLSKLTKGENPPCPNCESPMVKRVAKKGQYVGQEFWGCYSFPKCSGKIHIG